jgi:hypothetical protein
LDGQKPAEIDTTEHGHQLPTALLMIPLVTLLRGAGRRTRDRKPSARRYGSGGRFGYIWVRLSWSDYAAAGMPPSA